ncbi:hypothetical protein NKG94_24165 [Micromonospora sp. M12]
MSIIELGEVRDEPASVSPVRRPRAVGRPLRSGRRCCSYCWW